MKCLNCEGKSFSVKSIRIPTEVKGETVEVLVPTHVCNKCAEPLMDSKMMNKLRQAGADAYRAKHGLLISTEIAALRSNLNMSQRAFAEYLDVGEASIKRWETYFVQDHSQDQHIRLKCDPKCAERNAYDLKQKLHDDEFTGKIPFSEERFENMSLYLLGVCKSPLYLNKALFYCDFLHFKKHGRGISGSLYAKLDYGPCPEDFKIHFRRMKALGLVEEAKQGHDLKVLKKPDLKIFSDTEIEVINHIYELAKKDVKALYAKSHDEDAFTKSEFYELISYRHAGKLKLS